MEQVKRLHHDLVVWQEGMKLVEHIYGVARRLPDYEKYELSSQLRRAAVSVPANIAEGAGRNGQKEFLHFLTIARGSLCELETLLLLCSRLDYIKNIDTELKKLNETQALLNGLINAVRKRI
ncbi:four helix bundle protein [Desulfosediminicola sp.]|uniref:four helix bundle protein n=1 Tax=Desulfosediminicola sp. TaxID=2886825 RepID=UPI003AF2725F